MSLSALIRIYRRRRFANSGIAHLVNSANALGLPIIPLHLIYGSAIIRLCVILTLGPHVAQGGKR